jgi:hypothetical protein
MYSLIIQGALTQMDPVQIGHAAAYEAYRTRMSRHTEDFFDGFDRQRENIIGMAVGEGIYMLLLFNACILTC